MTPIKPWVLVEKTPEGRIAGRRYATKSAASRAANRRNREIEAGRYNNWLVTVYPVVVVYDATWEGR
jgi:hypothetical protein